MSYTPTDWKTGDVITAEKLNNIELGIVNNNNNSPLIVKSITDSLGDMTLDKTFREIANAYYAGRNVVIQLIDYPPNDEYKYFENVKGIDEDTSVPNEPVYRVIPSNSADGAYVITDENDYPKWVDEN